ncbi:hypothetical protein, partial [Mesorhizobium sp. M2D.F.Ca.ET.140.01.1.1]|uniref:hypothetical protein n=1 Tax=Mesorhizobium sp. M2D.F.Ca.ET.140.01.1.1 TaxID=2496664 RepID=UPI001AECB6AE
DGGTQAPRGGLTKRRMGNGNGNACDGARHRASNSAPGTARHGALRGRKHARVRPLEPQERGAPITRRNPSPT